MTKMAGTMWRLCLPLVICGLASGQKRAATGDLRIKSDQPGAAVSLDGRDAGETPVTLPNIPAGKHVIQLRKPGYLDYSQDIDFKPGKSGTVFVTLKKDGDTDAPPPALPVAFDVVHYHTAGRCSGVLAVERNIIRYKSSDGRETFQIPVRSVTLVARDAGNTMTAFAMVGGIAGAVGSGVGVVPLSGSASSPSALLPVRVETGGRKYSLVALGVRQGESPPASTSSREAAIESSDQLFAVADRVYRDDLKARPKK